MSTRKGQTTGREARRVLGVAGVCVLLTVLHTWPLATAPGTLSRNDNADTQLNSWTLAWVAHQLPREPDRLFDANTFYPEPRSLAFSEPLIVPALMVAPALWLEDNPVLAYNLALMLGMALTAFAGCLTIRVFTGSYVTAVVAGPLVASNAFTLTAIPHVQLQHGYPVVLALLGLDLLLARPRSWGAAALLGAALAAAALTSGYLAILAITAVTAAALCRAPEWARWRARPAWVRVATAAAVTGLVVGTVMWPYWLVHREQGLARLPATPPADIAVSYLATGARLHFGSWSQRFAGGRDFLFPGFLPLVLAGLALAWRRSRPTRRRQRMLLGVAVAGVLLSFGASNPLYLLLHRLFPPLRGVRVASRFGFLMLMAVALLAGYGAAVLQRRYGSRAWFPALIAALLVTMNAEVLRAPRPYREFDGFDPIYAVVAGLPGRVVLVEFPFFPPERSYGNAPYVLASTHHWKPLVNGSTSFAPESYRQRAEVLRRFPRPAALEELRRIGATHVILHDRGRNRGGSWARRLQRHERLTLVATDERGNHLFEIVSPIIRRRR